MTDQEMKRVLNQWQPLVDAAIPIKDDNLGGDLALIPAKLVLDFDVAVRAAQAALEG